MFVHAVSDGNLDAVRLFLQIGMSPNAHEKGDPHPMLQAAQLCANQPETRPRSQILEALVAAGGDVRAKDINSSTPLLWAVQTGCAPSAVRALLKAGADPSAKSKGGATPLMFADMFQRTRDRRDAESRRGQKITRRLRGRGPGSLPSAVGDEAARAENR